MKGEGGRKGKGGEGGQGWEGKFRGRGGRKGKGEGRENLGGGPGSPECFFLEPRLGGVVFIRFLTFVRV